MSDEFYMQRCLQLAQNGNAFTKPNPSVGAVIVSNNSIIGEGFTAPFGGPHAEVNAIASVGDKDSLKGATMYVTLEPCSHFGKTPPCANAIVQSGIQRVVIGCLDVNPEVRGNGIQILKEADIEVEVGVLQSQCDALHKSFFVQQGLQRPYIILKWAQTKNGFMAPAEQDDRNPFWISNQYSKQLVHKWRAQEQAILVGANTVLKDNPTLNTRDWYGQSPIRIVLDARLSTPLDSNVFNDQQKTIFIINASTEVFNSEDWKVTLFERINYSKDVAKQVCQVLSKYNIQSVIIEGGARTLETFIKSKLWDEARVFEGEHDIENGLKAPAIQGRVKSKQQLLADVLTIYAND